MTKTNDLPVCRVCERPPISFLSYEQTETYYCPKHTGLLSEAQWRTLMGGGEAVDLKTATYFYNSGYNAGHDDTVEGCHVYVLAHELSTYQDDVVSDVMDELGVTTPQPPAVPDGIAEKIRAAHRATHPTAKEILISEAVEMLGATTPPQDQER